MAPNPQPLHNRLDLAAEPSAVRWARLHAADVLRKWQVPGAIVDDARLVVSELVSNAIRHADTPSVPMTPESREGARSCSLTLWLMGGHLFILVYDGDQKPPVLRPAFPGEETGRGLQLVDQLSAGCWGYTCPASGGGKWVWARIVISPLSREPQESGDAAQSVPRVRPQRLELPGGVAVSGAGAVLLAADPEQESGWAARSHRLPPSRPLPGHLRTESLSLESGLRKLRDVQDVRPNGAAMRAIRTARKVSLRDMQARTGLDRGHLSRLERGLVGASYDTIRRYANALDVPTAAITHDR